MSLRRLWWSAFALVLTARLGLGQESVKSLSNSAASTRNVYVIAHQDDWQLFMGDVAARSLRSGAPATFVYLTAGDDGRDSVYWRTRERAALSSTRVAAGSAASASDSIGCTSVTVLEHSLRKCVVGSTTSFFLRLPDGKRNGAGFARHDFQSMRQLRTGKITSIAAVDGSSTYRGWKDLVATVNALIPNAADSQNVLNTTDPSIVVNPHDHFDHRMAGWLVEELRRQRKFETRYYIGYALATRADNRSTEQAQLKAVIFRAYDQEMMRVDKTWSAYGEHPTFYSECMVRTYARTPRTRGAR